MYGPSAELAAGAVEIGERSLEESVVSRHGEKHDGGAECV
jgi:hypothetical protein